MTGKARERLHGIRILHEDEAVIVIDKPAGMLTTHTKVAGRAAREAQITAENLLNDYVRKGQLKSRKRVWLVHRLDRETSGVMMFAKEERYAEKLREHWNGTTVKTYVAKVEGEMESDHGVFESHLKEDADGYRVRSVAKGMPGAKLAKTEWRVTKRGRISEVEIRLHSGRKNQIRVHFSEAGHPVVGDTKYRGRKAARMYLHSLGLGFTHPASGREMNVTAPLADAWYGRRQGMKLILATHNRNKVREISEILPGWEISAEDSGAEETAATFRGNALIKARALKLRHPGAWILADDSGLEVEALGGAPGVRSARYAGEEGNTPANNALLLKNLEGVADRRARFTCAVALIDPEGKEEMVEGHCPGRILTEPAGAGGFGYDPLFVPDGHDRTFAELTGPEKNAISHRGRALAKLRRILKARGAI